jgi:hypothetical protein
MSLPLNARFGLDSGPLELDGRELMLIQGALSSQRRYMLTLAKQAHKRPYSDPETVGRNMVNATEVKVLMEKIDKATVLSTEKGEGNV